jgi:hypothetical protein
MGIRRTTRTLKELFETAKYCRKLAPLWSLRYPAILLRASRLCRRQRFLPDEAFRLGLYNHNLAHAELSKFISRKNLTKIQKSVNPISWTPLLKDKGIFYRYCTALDLPIPKLYAIFFQTNDGWAYNGSPLRTPDEWKRFFMQQLPPQFVIKPCWSSCGHGVNFFNRIDTGFIDEFARSYEPEQLCQLLRSHREYDSFVIQQWLKNHPELLRLTGIEFLQTIRIITFVDRKNQCHIQHAHLKLITGQNVVDNFEHGLSGNIEPLVSLADGRLKSAVTLASDGSGVHTIPSHPKTKIAFDRFHLPLWDHACSLVKTAAPRFLPVRSIAWDVALTPNGPYIVEGNIWWSPPNQHRCLDTILDGLSCDMK